MTADHAMPWSRAEIATPARNRAKRGVARRAARRRSSEKPALLSRRVVGKVQVLSAAELEVQVAAEVGKSRAVKKALLDEAKGKGKRASSKAKDKDSGKAGKSKSGKAKRGAGKSKAKS